MAGQLTLQESTPQMVKHTQTIRRQKLRNCLSVLDLFVELALKGLNFIAQWNEKEGIKNILSCKALVVNLLWICRFQKGTIHRVLTLKFGNFKTFPSPFCTLLNNRITS